MTEPLARGGWLLVLPVKNASTAKSRLTLPAPLRARVARAMALDTCRAAVLCPAVLAVVVVTDEASEDFTRLGADTVPDAPRSGLNAALSHGAATAVTRFAPRRRGPGAGPPGVAALTADLPALRPAELRAALTAVPQSVQAAVADLAGAGTTLLASADGRLQPRFGDRSHRRHLDNGAIDLTAAAGPGLRRDVDTVADLRAASVLGLGPATAALWSELQQWLPDD